MSHSHLDDMISLMLKYKQYNFRFDNNDMAAIIDGLSEVPFFNKLQAKIGYANMVTLAKNINLQCYNEGDIAYKYTSNGDLIFHLIKGQVKEVVFLFDEQKTMKNVEMKCLSKCFFVEVDCFFFTNLLKYSSEEAKMKFSSALMLFDIGPLTNLFCDKMYLIYRPQEYHKDEYLYREKDESDGLYFVISGEFLLSKRMTHPSHRKQIEMIDKEIHFLKDQHALLEFCFRRGFSFNSRLLKSLKTSSKYNTNPIASPKLTLLSKTEDKSLKLLTVKGFNLIGDLELKLKAAKRLFDVRCVSDKALASFITYEQFSLINNSDVMNKVCHHAQKKEDLINNRLNDNMKIHSLKRKPLEEAETYRTSRCETSLNEVLHRTSYNTATMKKLQIAVPKRAINKKLSSITPYKLRPKTQSKKLSVSRNTKRTEGFSFRTQIKSQNITVLREERTSHRTFNANQTFSPFKMQIKAERHLSPLIMKFK